MVKQRLPHEDGEEGSRMGKAFQMDGIGNEHCIKNESNVFEEQKENQGPRLNIARERGKCGVRSQTSEQGLVLGGSKGFGF